MAVDVSLAGVGVGTYLTYGGLASVLAVDGGEVTALTYGGGVASSV